MAAEADVRNALKGSSPGHGGAPRARLERRARSARPRPSRGRYSRDLNRPSVSNSAPYRKVSVRVLESLVSGDLRAPALLEPPLIAVQSIRQQPAGSESIPTRAFHRGTCHLPLAVSLPDRQKKRMTSQESGCDYDTTRISLRAPRLARRFRERSRRQISRASRKADPVLSTVQSSKFVRLLTES
jgi:hypothetical protein